MEDDITDILEYATLTSADPDANGRSGTVSAGGIISWAARDIAAGQQ